MKLSFFVPGIPAPGGSKKAFVNKHTGRASIVDDCKRNGPWKERVALFAREAYQGDPCRGPLRAEFYFTMPRLKGHYRTGKNAHLLRPDAPCRPIVKPDTTKLVRAAEDALKGILWSDDAQIVEQSASKCYGDRPGVLISVWTKE